MSRRVLCACVLSLCRGLSVFAQQSSPAGSAGAVPPLVNFSGVLTAADSGPATGMVGITFLLYKESQGGVPLWMETQNVQPDKSGHYSVVLGSTSGHGLPADLFAAGQGRWLGVQPQGEPEQPRVLMVSVPYALKAADAETIGGLPPSAFMLAPPPTNSAPGAASSSQSTASTTPAVSGTGTTDFLPLWLNNSGALGNSVLFQSGSGGTAKVGINTGTPVTALDVNGWTTVRGALIVAASGTASASAGKNSEPLSLVASAFNSGTGKAQLPTFHLQAEPTGNDTSSPSGTLNLLFTPNAGAPSETGFRIASNGLVHFVSGQTFPGTGTITGVTAGSGLAGGGSTGNVTLSLLKTCASGQVLQWSGTTWACSSAGSGTITGVTAGTDLTGGGASGSVTVNLDVTKVPQLASANHFTANQSVTGNISATGSISAGTLSGNGAAVTGVNAALLNGFSSSSFALLAGGNTFPANQFFNGNGKQMIVGDPGCGSGYAAIGFGALSGCNNYSLLGDGTNTFINRPKGGSIFFRENNGADMTIAPGGAVSITESLGGCCPPALDATSNSEGNDGVQSFGGGGASEFGSGGRGLLAEGGTETNTNSTGGGDGVDAYGGNGFQGGLGMYVQGGNSSAVGGADALDTQAGTGVGASGYSGFFQGGDVNVLGNLGVSGQIFAGIKDFRIDHPLDPANKYLYHASVESSEMMNIYTGNVILDGSGAASVALPEWFEALNSDYRYQLTAIGAAAPNLHIAQEVTNHQFSIAGGAPGMKVSWQVTGVRHDAFAQANPMVAEVEKPANERGFYINPALYGQPEEKQIEWGRFPAKMRLLKQKRVAPGNPASGKK